MPVLLCSSKIKCNCQICVAGKEQAFFTDFCTWPENGFPDFLVLSKNLLVLSEYPGV